MARILLINNGTYHTQEMLDLLTEHKVEVTDFRDLHIDMAENKDAIILTGGHLWWVENHKDKYEQELNLISSTELPIFGVCLWFELLVVSEGNHLTSLPEKVKGDVTVRLLQDDPIFTGIDTDTLAVNEAHRRGVTQAEWFDILWESPNWIEIIKKPNSLVYGTQFHPELLDHEARGYVLLENFLKMVEKRD